MALNKLAHLERLLQEITEKFNSTNYRLSAAWSELESTRETLQQLVFVCYLLHEEQGRIQKK